MSYTTREQAKYKAINSKSKQMEENWRKHFEKAKRGALITIKNYTKNVLDRVSYSLDHGKWTMLPQGI